MRIDEGEALAVTDETELLLPFTFTDPEPDFFTSCMDVAVTVTTPEAGAVSGAV